MEFIEGNLLDLFETQKMDILVHGCNCFHTMGAGIAKQIKWKYKEAYTADLQQTKKGDRSKLGTYSIAWINESQCILNAYTQYHFTGSKPVDYDAIRSVFRMIDQNFQNKVIGIPKIGAGLAQGNWNTIQTIIEEETHGNRIICVLYKL